MSEVIAPPLEAPTIEEQGRIALTMRHLHMVLQSKGGIGKSLVARILGEYLSADCFDCDNLNRTFSKFHGLNVETIALTADGATMSHGKGVGSLNQRAADDLFTRAMQELEGQHCVIDTGAQTYLPLLDYIVECDLAGMSGMIAPPVMLWFHLIVAGGQAQQETLEDTARIIKRLKHPHCRFVIWENPFAGPVREGDSEGVANTRLYQGFIADHATHLIVLKRHSGMFDEDIERMQREGRTWTQMIDDPNTPAIVRSRMMRAQRAMFDQLDQAFSATRVAKMSMEVAESASRGLAKSREREAEEARAASAARALAEGKDPEEVDAFGDPSEPEGEEMKVEISTQAVDPSGAPIADDFDDFDDFDDENGDNDNERIDSPEEAEEVAAAAERMRSRIRRDDESGVSKGFDSVEDPSGEPSDDDRFGGED